MPLTNKAIGLRLLRKLNDVFNDKELISIERCKNIPFGFIVRKRNGLKYEVIRSLEKLGFYIVEIAIILDNNTPISIIQIYRHEIEKESGWDNSFADFSKSDFYKVAKEIGTEEYWRVKYNISFKENSNIWRRNFDNEKKIEDLQKEIQKLNEENHKLLKEIHSSIKQMRKDD